MPPPLSPPSNSSLFPPSIAVYSITGIQATAAIVLNAAAAVWAIAPNCPVVQQYSGHMNPIRDLLVIPYSFTLDGKPREANSTILSGAEDGKVMMWDVSSGSTNLKEFYIGNALSYPVTAVELLPGSAFLETGDYKIRLFSFGGVSATKTFIGHSSYVQCLKYLGDGTFLSGAGDMTIIRWNIQTGVKMMTFPGHTGAVYALEAMRDGTFISGAGDGKVKRWKLGTAVAMETYATGSSVNALAVLDDSNFLTAGYDYVIKQFKMGTLTPVFQYDQIHTNVIGRLMLVDSSIISSGFDGYSYRWVLGRKDPVTKYIHGGFIFSSAYIGDGTFITGGNSDNLIKRFSLYGNDTVVYMLCFRFAFSHTLLKQCFHVMI
jgi:WD40 repeat protein